MRSTKWMAFMVVIGCIFLVFLTVVILLVQKMVAELPVGQFLTAFVGVGTSYIVGSVANNGVRGKWYNEGVARVDKENE